MKKFILLLLVPPMLIAQNQSEILNGTWNIVNIEYEANLDFAFVEDIIGFNPGNQEVSGQATNAGFWTFQYPEGTYNNSVNFTTDVITIPIPIIGDYDIPGVPIDISTSGTWSLINNEYTLVTTDEMTGIESYYDIISINNNNATISGVVQFSEEIMGQSINDAIDVTIELEKEGNSTIIELENNARKLIKTIDILGRINKNQLLQLQIYNDGSVEKTYFIK
tara:strand:+ start:274 stop:939 length:666 start_codon:yes stop_codon:yes gene_type:complete